MHELTVEDRIWNRACFGRGRLSRPGDSALAALLRFHGAAMNGGVLNAIECLEASELAAAQAGYSYFGYEGVISVIRKAQQAISEGQDLSDLEAKFDLAYAAEIPDDHALVEVFQTHYQVNRTEYSLPDSD